MPLEDLLKDEYADKNTIEIQFPLAKMGVVTETFPNFNNNQPMTGGEECIPMFVHQQMLRGDFFSMRRLCQALGGYQSHIACSREIIAPVRDNCITSWLTRDRLQVY